MTFLPPYNSSTTMSPSPAPGPILASSAHSTHHLLPSTSGSISTSNQNTVTNTSTGTNTSPPSSSSNAVPHHRSPVLVHNSQSSSHSSPHNHPYSRPPSISPRMLPRDRDTATRDRDTGVGNSTPPVPPSRSSSSPLQTLSLGSASQSMTTLSSMLASALHDNDTLRAELGAALGRAAKAERLVSAFRSASINPDDGKNGSTSNANANLNSNSSPASSHSQSSSHTQIQTIAPKSSVDVDGSTLLGSASGACGENTSLCGVYSPENVAKVILDYDERLERAERTQESLLITIQTLLSSWSELERYLSSVELRAQDARGAFGRDVMASLEAAAANGVSLALPGLTSGSNGSSGGGLAMGGFRALAFSGSSISEGAFGSNANANGSSSASSSGARMINGGGSFNGNNLNNNSNNSNNNGQSHPFGSLTLPPILPHHSSLSAATAALPRHASAPGLGNGQSSLPPLPFSTQQGQMQLRRLVQNQQNLSQMDHVQQSVNANANANANAVHQLVHPQQQNAGLQQMGSGSGYWPNNAGMSGPGHSNGNGNVNSNLNANANANAPFQTLPLPPPPSAIAGPNSSNRQVNVNMSAGPGMSGRKRMYDEEDVVGGGEDGPRGRGGKRSRVQQQQQQQQQQQYLEQGAVAVTNGVGRQNVAGVQGGSYSNLRERERMQQTQQQQGQGQGRYKDMNGKSISIDTLNNNGREDYTRGRDADRGRVGLGEGRRDRSASSRRGSRANSAASARSTSTMSIDEMLLAASGTDPEQGASASAGGNSAYSGSARKFQAYNANGASTSTASGPGGERIQLVRPETNIGPHKEPPSVGEYQVHLFAEPVVSNNNSTNANNSVVNGKQKKAGSFTVGSGVNASAAAKRSITRERSLPNPTSANANNAGANANANATASQTQPPPHVQPLPSGTYPPTNDLGQRICRQCGVAGRYKDGKCVEKWGPGPEGPGTVCDRCRKKMKRVARMQQQQQQQNPSPSAAQGGLKGGSQSLTPSQIQDLRFMSDSPELGPTRIGGSRKAYAALLKQMEEKEQRRLLRAQAHAQAQAEAEAQAQAEAQARMQEGTNSNGSSRSGRQMMTPPYITSISTKEQHAARSSSSRNQRDRDGSIYDTNDNDELDDVDEDMDVDAEAELEDDAHVHTQGSSSSNLNTILGRKMAGSGYSSTHGTSYVRTPPSSVDPEEREQQSGDRAKGSGASKTLPNVNIEDVDADADADAEVDAEAENDTNLEKENPSRLNGASPSVRSMSSSTSPFPVRHLQDGINKTILNLPTPPSHSAIINGPISSIRGEVKAESA